MKTIILYVSYHHMNTQKIAIAMAHAMGAEALSVEKADAKTIDAYDLIGMGSGIYYGKFDKRITDFIAGYNWKGKKTFVFSTSGFDSPKFNNPTMRLLEEKGAKVLGSFHCRGYDTYPLFKLVGGLSKGYPDEEDIRDAEKFGVEILKLASEL
jgi:flavodoxin